MTSQIPEPLLHLVVIRPKIAGNIGALVRLCAATGAVLHICGELSFDPHDKRMRRAGLDYWSSASVFFHHDVHACLRRLNKDPFIIEVCGDQTPWEASLTAGSVCVFGPEDGSVSPTGFGDTSGTLRIPMQNVRSLNLAQSASILSYEAMRQQTTKANSLVSP